MTPIAVVGMSCRLSGDVSNLDDFWTLLSRSRDGWCEIPEERFSSKAYYHPNPQKTGVFNPKGGYFMKREYAHFDAPFFNITKQEAIAMDPQQRQLLEVTYEALENAGISKENIAGRNMGVYIAGRASDYRLCTLKEVNQVPMFDATGNHASIQAGRISYYFNLRGPAFTLDTACSSGLYALHSAVQGIRSGEADSAIVAGCCLRLQPDELISMSMLGIFNEHGRTFAFDHRAKSGFAPGEGVGCLILKPLDQALRDNDKICSVIVNTGTNQDGKTVGLSTPSGEAQEQLMRDVYARAGIDFNDVGFVEAHGTGTKVGDPIEAGAIQRVFGAGRTRTQPLYVGSVKTNIGHLENASGIISVIKASLMLDKGFILPNVNYETANPAIPLKEWNMRVPISVRPWPKGKKYISINNFGFGGSNAHVVLERPPALTAMDMPQEARNESTKLFVLSANDEEAAKRKASQLGVYIEQHPEAFQKRLVRDMAYTLGNRRTHLPYRIALTASSLNDLALALNSPDALPVRASKAPKLAFAFTGQGAQWPTMGVELLDTHEAFAKTVRDAETVLNKLGADFALIEELKKPKEQSRVGEPHISQPACTAIQLGLVELLKSWGVTPSCVVGHSSGEIGAAYATGAITLDDAMAAAFYRGRLASNLKTKYPDLRGGMLAVGKGPEEIKATIKSLELQGVTVACENSPQSITASGDVAAVDKLAAELESQGAFNRKLRVDVAYHSAHMELVAEEYMATIKDIQPAEKSEVQMYSSLFGKKLESTTALGASYWVQNLTKPVLFSSAVHELCVDAQPDVIIEIGPHGALEGPIKQIVKAAGKQAAGSIKYLPSLVRGKNASDMAVKLAGGLFVQGLPVNFNAINETNSKLPPAALITDFAPYPWTEHRYWFESRSSKQHRLQPFGRHDLLGLLDDSSSDVEPTWRNVLSVDNVPWLKDHRMQSLTTFPLAGYLCMAVEAANRRAKLRGISADEIDSYCLREVRVPKALIMDDGADYETLVTLRPFAEGTRSYSDEWDEFRFSSWTSSRGWLEHCRCLVSVKKADAGNPVTASRLSEAAVRRSEAQKLDEPICHQEFYTELEDLGAGYGSLFQLQPAGALRASGDYSISKVTVPDTASVMPHEYENTSILPTSFMDLFFQLTFPILGAGKGQMPSLFMPSAIKEVVINAKVPNTVGGEVEVIAQGHVDFANPSPVDFQIDAWHSAGGDEPVIKLTDFRMTPVGNNAMEGATVTPLCYKVDWEPLVPEPQVIDDTSSTNGSIQLESGQKSPADKLFSAPVVIVTDRDESDPLVTELASCLGANAGQEVSVSKFSSEEIDAKHYLVLSELDAPLLNGIDQTAFERVQELLITGKSILWVSAGAYLYSEKPENNIAQGVLRTVRSEFTKVAATLDLDPNSQLAAPEQAKLITTALSASLTKPEDDASVDYEFAESCGALVVPRVSEQEDMNLQLFRETENAEPYLQPFESAEGRRLKIAVATAGALDSIYWRDDPELTLAADEIEIKVAATGMNFKDVVVAMGQVAQPYLGVECSGTVARVGSGATSLKVGDRVCAMSLGAYSSYARCPATSAAIIPEGMTFETAASIPVVYSTAYYGLMDLARLEPGESILIHAASGGVGQAAIQLAQMVGAEIFATVGSADKKQLLIDAYGIPEERIFYSRNSSFGPAIREATGGKGVDVVINSLAGDLLRETWESLAHFGRFVEIGKRDINSNTRLEMAKFEYNCSFSSVDLTLVAAERPKIMGRVLNAVMSLLEKKTITPISPVTMVDISEVETALRKLQSGKTTGKLVVRHNASDLVKATHPQHNTALLEPNATYIIIGGTGGIGRSLTKRMIQRGARNIVLLSRSGKVSEVLSILIEQEIAKGANVLVKVCDVSKASSVNTVVADIKATLPPIRGVIHAAMVLRDVLFEKMTYEDYSLVVESKIAGGWNFHQALISDPLDFFIVLSSVAGIVGNRGQAAYAGANTFLDALVQHRLRKGLKATSLNLTAVDGVGYLAENTTRASTVRKNLAGNSMNEAKVLALIEASISGLIGSVSGEQCVTGLDFSDGANLPYYASDGKFSRLREEALEKARDSSALASAANRSISQVLKAATTMDEAVEVVAGGLRDKLSAILMIAPEVMAPTASLSSFGLDSLNAIELRNWIGKELQSHLQVLELLTSGAIDDLAALILKKTRFEGVWTQKAE
ncbi:hypothetical protein BX600DRAFT_384985 [Xylariales sp. PMI_506]|nr:hypothetical protein BX600DRAFT_384985 [Xylariales sp. PMI_506]